MGVTNLDAVTTNEGALHPEHYEILHFYIAGVQSVGAKKNGAVIPFAGTIVDVRAHVDTAPATTSIILDLLKNGASLYTTTGNRPTIAAALNDSTTLLPDTVAVAAGDRLTFDVLQIGTGTVGSDLYFSVTLKRSNVA